MDSCGRANKLWAPPPLVAKSWDYLAKLEPKTDQEHSATVSRVREWVGVVGWCCGAHACAAVR
jgi:hypothetical protein